MGEKERLTLNAINKERCCNGADFLDNLIFCDGRAVVVKGTFNTASRKANKLIFTTIRPYNENIKTMKKICDELIFPIDALWKVRLLETAVHKEIFYIIGHITVRYANGKPQGTLALAPDVFNYPILTASQFEEHYSEFCDKCYKWPVEGKVKIIAMPLLKSIKRVTGIKDSQDIKTEKKGNSINEPIRKVQSNQDYLLQYEKKHLRGRKLDESVKKASELPYAANKPKSQCMNQEVKEKQDSSQKTVTDDSALPVTSQWEQEFNTKKRTLDYFGCSCELINDIVFISTSEEKWQIRYSRLYNRLILYHKNSKSVRQLWKEEVVEGYHEQYVPSLNGMPTIKEYIIYTSLHNLMIEKNKELEKRNRRLNKR
jgi:hypothetical protein